MKNHFTRQEIKQIAMEDSIKITDDSKNANALFLQNMSSKCQVAAGPTVLERR